jgi:hypothetical protein
MTLSTTPALLCGTLKFATWLGKVGHTSHDPYDVWGTPYGLWSRKLYYKRQLLGVPFIAPVLALETLLPSYRKWFVAKQRFATADGQLLLAFLNLYQVTGEQPWLEKASKLAPEILAYSIPGYSGHCWGYPFDWQNSGALWKRNTPYITATPYCFEAFLRLYDATQNPAHQDVAASAARFVFTDLRDNPTSTNAAAGSYSPIDNSKVVNASAYRAWVLFEAGFRWNKQDYLDKAWRNLRFILQSQREDGAWLYAMDDPKGSFIDHFHTCFVLKNLFKINLRLQDPEVKSAIHKGYAYYRQTLFDAEGVPKYYAKKPRTEIVRLEMYNLAEAITLGALLRNEIPEAFQMANHLAQLLVEKYQLPDGHFVTRVYRGGIRHTFPFLRWPQAQLFYALTNLLVAIHSQEKTPHEYKRSTGETLKEVR